MLERWGQRSWSPKRWLMSCCIRLRLICRPEMREEESSLIEGAWEGLVCGCVPQINWAKVSRVAQRNKWVRGRLIMTEESWCKRIEQHQRGIAVVACGGFTNRWERRDVLWIVYSWSLLSQKTNSNLQNSGLRQYCECYLKRCCFVLRVWFV